MLLFVVELELSPTIVVLVPSLEFVVIDFTITVLVKHLDSELELLIWQRMAETVAELAKLGRIDLARAFDDEKK